MAHSKVCQVKWGKVKQIWVKEILLFLGPIKKTRPYLFYAQGQFRVNYTLRAKKMKTKINAFSCNIQWTITESFTIKDIFITKTRTKNFSPRGGGGSYLMCESREKGSRGYDTIPIHGKFKPPYFNKVELQKLGLGRTHPCPPENKIISQYPSPLGKISWSAHVLELISPFICLIDKKVTYNFDYKVNTSSRLRASHINYKIRINF